MHVERPIYNKHYTIREKPYDVLDAAHVRREEAARNERVDADAALPVVHLAALEGVVVGAGRAVVVDRSTYIVMAYMDMACIGMADIVMALYSCGP